MVTDVSTTWAEVIIRVNWIVVVSRMFLVQLIMWSAAKELNPGQLPKTNLENGWVETLNLWFPDCKSSHLAALLPKQKFRIKQWILTFRLWPQNYSDFLFIYLFFYKLNEILFQVFHILLMDALPMIRCSFYSSQNWFCVCLQSGVITQENNYCKY